VPALSTVGRVNRIGQARWRITMFRCHLKYIEGSRELEKSV